MIALSVKNLCVYVGKTRLLGPIHFSISRGSTLVVMGETGAGKSLLIQAILGVLPQGLYAEGEIELNGKRIDTLPHSERTSLWGKDITTLPQEAWQALDPLMKSWRQIYETHHHVAELSSTEAKKETSRNLLSLGLTKREPRLPGTLSGGMAQRVAFATASAGQAHIFLADEPTKGLDTQHQSKLIKLLQQVPQREGALLTITHESSVAKALGGELIILQGGNLIEQGKSKKIFSKPQQSYTKELFSADPETWPITTPISSTRRKVVLNAQNISISRGKRILFEGFNLTLHKGEKVAICGPSGIGKTSLIDALAGLIEPTSGHINRAESLTKYSIQKLYQDPLAAFPPAVPISATLHDVATLHHCSWNIVSNYMFELKLLPTLLERRPHAVSGGELQRIAIVRALITNPKILLADEPTSRLDPITQKQTLDLISKISSKKSIAVVMVTHNPAIAQKWAERSITL